MMVGDHPVSPFGRTEAYADDEYWEERAKRAEAALATAREEAARLRDALERIREYERNEDEAARDYGVLEPDRVGYCFSIADAALNPHS